MNFQDFMVKWQGKPVDFDGVFPNQCFDLAHQYVYDVLGLTNKTILAHPSACQIFDNFTETDYFDKIENTPTGIPLEGDIVVFKCTSALPFGHVCIFVEGDANKFRSFDANWPTGSLPHIQEHTYGYCAGWLHPKSIAPDLQSQLDQTRLERDRNWDWFTSVCTALGVGANVDAAVNEANKLVANDDTLVQKDKQIQELQTQLTDLTGQFNTLQTNHEKMRVEEAQLAVQASDLKAKFQQAENQLTEALGKLALLQQASQQPVLTGWRKLIMDFILKF